MKNVWIRNMAVTMCTGTIVFASVVESRAQDWEDSIITDRPDITESSATVGKGRFQLETSALWERNTSGADVESWLMPTLMRYGVSENLELRIEGDWLTYEDVKESGGGSTSGYSPFSVGMKYHLQDYGDAWSVPDMGVLLHIGIPSGSGAFTSDHVSGEIKLAMEWELADGWGLGTNFGAGFDYDDDDDSFVFATATAAVGHDWTDRLATFWEVAYQGPESSRDEHALIFDTGVTYLFTPDFQLDAAVGTGLDGETTPDIFITAGISMRF